MQNPPAPAEPPTAVDMLNAVKQLRALVKGDKGRGRVDAAVDGLVRAAADGDTPRILTRARELATVTQSEDAWDHVGVIVAHAEGREG